MANMQINCLSEWLAVEKEKIADMVSKADIVFPIGIIIRQKKAKNQF